MTTVLKSTPTDPATNTSPDSVSEQASAQRVGLKSSGNGLALMAVILFATTTPIVKGFLKDIPPMWLSATVDYGIGFGMLFLWAIGGLLGKSPYQRLDLQMSEVKWLVGTIVMGSLIAPLLIVHALDLVPAINISLFSSAEGVFTVLISWLLFKGSLDKRVILGALLISMGGGCLVAGHIGDTLVTTGAMLALMAYMSWAVDTNIIAKLSHRNPVQMLCLKSLPAAMMLTVFLLTTQPIPEFDLNQLLLLGSIGFIGYGVSYILFLKSVHLIGAARAGSFMSLNPFIGVTYGVLLLQEPLTQMFMFSLALVAWGIYLLSSSRKKKQSINA